MTFLDELAKSAEEEKAFPSQTLEQWPALLRHRRAKDPKGVTRLDEYEVERLCNLIARAVDEGARK